MHTPIQPTLFNLVSRKPLRTLAERPLREWPVGERPVERLIAVGPSALSDVELLAVLFMGSGAGKTNPVALAQELICTFGNWRELQQATLDELADVPHLGRTRAAQVQAVLELTRRILLAPPGDRLQVKSPHDIAQLLMADMGHLDQEELRVVLLDTKNRVQTIHTVYRGSLNTSLVRIGEVFKQAIRRNSAALIVCHNHPSTDPTPSPEDVLVTRQIVSAGAMLDIDVLDHLIICEGRFISMRERGLGFTK
jgi:DNA repair protein RadC